MKKKQGGWRKPAKTETTTSFRVRAELVSEADQLAAAAGLSRAAILRMAVERGLPVVREKLLLGAEGGG